jgi:hypothetical protein
MNAYSDVQMSGNIWTPQTNLRAYPGDQEPLRPAPEVASGLLDYLEEQMVTFEASHRRSLADVKQHYVLPSDTSVIEFLKSHRTLPALLLEAAPKLKKFFGDRTVFLLTLMADEEGSETLYGVALWPGALADAIAALAQFDEDWWLPRANQGMGYLSFTYELV